MQKRGNFVFIVLSLVIGVIAFSSTLTAQSNLLPCCSDPDIGPAYYCYKAYDTKPEQMDINDYLTVDMCCGDGITACPAFSLATDGCDSVQACQDAGCCCTENSPLGTLTSEGGCSGVIKHFFPGVFNTGQCNGICEKQYECSDGIDNDNDGKTDYDPDGNGDPQCDSPTHDSEADGGTLEEDCTTAEDEDGDGFASCLDSECRQESCGTICSDYTDHVYSSADDQVFDLCCADGTSAQSNADDAIAPLDCLLDTLGADVCASECPTPPPTCDDLTSQGQAVCDTQDGCEWCENTDPQTCIVEGGACDLPVLPCDQRTVATCKDGNDVNQIKCYLCDSASCLESCANCVGFPVQDASVWECQAQGGNVCDNVECGQNAACETGSGVCRCDVVGGDQYYDETPDSCTPEGDTIVPPMPGGRDCIAENLCSECGNGIREEGEDCDDGNEIDDDDCGNDCRWNIVSACEDNGGKCCPENTLCMGAEGQGLPGGWDCTGGELCYTGCTSCVIATEENCRDGSDVGEGNDHDGKPDCLDFDCHEDSCGMSNCQRTEYENNVYDATEPPDGTLDTCCFFSSWLRDCDEDGTPEACRLQPCDCDDGAKTPIFPPATPRVAFDHKTGGSDADHAPEITITWDFHEGECDTAANFNIYRCDKTMWGGEGCQEGDEDILTVPARFDADAPLNEIPLPGATRSYLETNVAAGKDYCYLIEANYGPTSMFSKVVCTYTGDEICFIEDGQFCFDPEGLVPTRGYQCSEENTFTPTSTDPYVKSDDEIRDCNEFTEGDYEAICREKSDNTVDCFISGPCEPCNFPMGMFYSWQDSITELSDGEWDNCHKAETGCFLEYSMTTVDQFRSCKDIDSCYAYRSEKACEGTYGSPYTGSGNPCLDNACEWVPIMPEFGVGVCRDTEPERQECSWCDEGHYNQMLGSCTEQLCQATGEECYLDEEGSCLHGSTLSCESYDDREDCLGRGQISGIKVDVGGRIGDGRTNDIYERSQDFLGFGLCSWSTTDEECFKDANYDASRDPHAKDLFPPITHVQVPTWKRPQGVFPDQDLYLADEIVISGVVTDQYPEGVLCKWPDLDAPNNADNKDNCTGPTKLFYAIYSLNPLSPERIVRQIMVEPTNVLVNTDGTIVETTKELESGIYQLFYYAMDKADNLEVVKNLTIEVDKTDPVITFMDPPTFTLGTPPDFESDVLILFSVSEEVTCTADRLTKLDDPEWTDLPFIPGEFPNLYGVDFYAQFETLLDGSYEYEVTCNDRLGNEAVEKIEFRIEADRRITTPKPEGTIDYSTEILLQVFTENNAVCEIMNHGGTEWELMTTVPNPDGTGYFHEKTVADLGPSPDRTYIHDVRCTFEVSGDVVTDSIVFTVDTTRPAIRFLDDSGNDFNFAVWYGEDSPPYMYIECVDDGFGCEDDLYFCTSTFLEEDCDPETETVPGASNGPVPFPISELAGHPSIVSQRICVEGLEQKSPDETMGGRETEPAVCHTIMADQVGPELFVNEVWVESEPYRTTDQTSITLTGSVLDYGYHDDSGVSATGGEVVTIEDHTFREFTLNATLEFEGTKGDVVVRRASDGEMVVARIDKTNPLPDELMLIHFAADGSIVSQQRESVADVEATIFKVKVSAQGDAFVFEVADVGRVTATFPGAPALGEIGVSAPLAAESTPVKISDIRVIDEEIDRTKNKVRLEITNVPGHMVETFCDANGHFEATLTGLQEGENTIRIRGFDRAGNVDIASAGGNKDLYGVFVDNYGPVISGPFRLTDAGGRGIEHAEYGQPVMIEIDVDESTLRGLDTGSDNAQVNVTRVMVEINGKTYEMGFQDDTAGHWETGTWNITIPVEDVAAWGVGTFIVTFTAEDEFGHTATAEFTGEEDGFNVKDETVPVLNTLIPTFEVYGSALVTNAETIDLIATYTELRPLNISVQIVGKDENGDTVFTVLKEEGLTGGTDQTITITVPLYPGQNDITMQLWDESYNVNTGTPAVFSNGKNQLRVFRDIVAPDITEPTIKGEGSGIGKKIEYGTNATIEFTVDDTRYTKHVTEVALVIQHEDGTAHGSRTAVYTNEEEGPVKIKYEMNVTETGYGIFDLEIGNYTVTVTATDAYGNTEPTVEAIFEIVDTTPPEIILEIQEMGEVVEIISRGNSNRREYDVVLFANEPIKDISTFSYQYNPPCDDVAIPEFAQTFAPRTDTEERVWEGKLWIPLGYACYNDADEEEIDFIIEGIDHNDFPFSIAEGDITPESFIMDNVGPAAPVFYFPTDDMFPRDADISDPYYSIEETVTVFGYTVDSDEDAIGDVPVVVLHSPDQTAWSNIPVQSSQESACGEQARLESLASEGATEVFVNGNFEQYGAGGFNLFIEYDHRADYTYYPISGAAYDDIVGRTRITLSEPLEKEANQGTAVMRCPYPEPTGYFLAAIPLGEGRTYIRARSQDLLSNWGETTGAFLVIKDLTPPVLVSTTPDADYISAEPIDQVRVEIEDPGAGFNCSSFNLTIEMYNMTDAGDEPRYCASCDIETECEDGDTEAIFILLSDAEGGLFDKDGEEGLDEGIYYGSISVRDLAGNELTHEWVFTTDSNSTHIPMLSVADGFTYGRTLYVPDLRPDLVLNYAYDNNKHIEILSMGKTPEESPQHQPIYTRINNTAFSLAFSQDLWEDFGLATPLSPTTLHRLLVESRKEYSSDNWSNVGSHSRFFVVDVTDPVLDPAPVAVRNATPVVNGSWDDRNINYVTVYGADVLGNYNATLVEDGYAGTYSVTVQLNNAQEGLKDILVRAWDKAGNPSEEMSAEVMLDYTAPIASCGYGLSGTWTNQAQTVILTGSDSISSVGRILYCEGEECSPTIVYEEPIPYDIDTEEIVRFQVFDLADNPSDNMTCRVMIDLTPPTVDINKDVADDASVNTDATFDLTADCDISGCAWLRWCDGEGCDPASGYEYNAPVTVSAEGGHVIRYGAQDNAGNLADVGEIRFAIDKTSAVLDPVTFENDNIFQLDELTYRTNRDNLTISGTISEPADVVISVTDASKVPKLTDVESFSENVKLNVRGKDNSLHTVTIEITDPAGNIATYDFMVEYDMRGPVINVTSPVQVCDHSGCTYHINTNTPSVIVETDRDAVCRIDPYLSGTFIDMTMGGTEHGYDGYGVLIENDYGFAVECTGDQLGNTNTQQFTFTVDTTAPELVLGLTNGEWDESLGEENVWRVMHREDGLIQTRIKAEDTAIPKDDIVCWYESCEGCTPGQGDLDNQPPFGNDTLYMGNQQERVIYPVGTNDEYLYTIDCRDRASNVATGMIRVINNVPSQIQVVETYPSNNAFIGSNDFTFYAVTNEYGECTYNDGAVQALDGAAYNHTTRIRAEDGWYRYDIVCTSSDSPTSTSSTVSFTVDTEPPSAPTISADIPEGIPAANDAPTFQFQSEDSAGIKGFSYELTAHPSTRPDEEQDTDGNSASFSELEGGTYYFHVRAVDNAGIWGETAHYMIIIDTSAPEAPKIKVDPEYSRDGRINVSGTTSSEDEVVDVTIEVLYDSMVLAGSSVTVISDGKFSSSIILPGDYEHYEIRAYASDRLGNGAGLYSNVVDAFRIQTGPSLIGTRPYNNERICEVKEVIATLESYGEIEISGASTMVIEDSNGQEVVEDNGNVDVKIDRNAGTAKLTFKPAENPLPDGAYGVAIFASDVLGNTAEFYSYFEVNQYAPCIGWNITPNVTPLDQIVLNPIQSPTGNRIVQISGTVRYTDGTPADQATVEILVKKDDGAYGLIDTIRTDASGGFLREHTFRDGEGPYFIKVEAHDYTGSSASSLTTQVNYVSSAPDMVLVSPAEGSRTREADTVTYYLAQQDDAIIVSHDEMLIETSTGRRISTTVEEIGCSVPECTIMKRLMIGEVLPDGTYEVRVNADDILGNSELFTPTFEIDTDVPEIVFETPTSREFEDDTVFVVENSLSVLGRIQSDNPPFTGTLQVNSRTPEQMDIYEYSGSWRFTTPIRLEDGDNRLRYRITDASGNEADVTVVAHKKPSGFTPQVIITSPQSGGTLTRTNILVGTYSHPKGYLDRMRLLVNGQQAKEVEFASGTFSTDVTISEGTDTITIEAIDRWQDTVSDEITLTYGGAEVPYTVVLDPITTPTNNPGITVQGRVDDIASGLPAGGVDVLIGVGSTSRTITAEMDGSFSEPWTLRGANQMHIVSVSALAGDGFPSEPAFQEVWYVTAIPGFSASPNSQDTYHTVETIVLQAEQIDDATLGVSNPSLVSGTSNYAVTGPSPEFCGHQCRSFVFAVDEDLADGDYVFSYRVSDTLQETDRETRFTVDSEAPLIRITTPIELEDESGDAAISGIYVGQDTLHVEGIIEGVGISSSDDVQETNADEVFPCGNDVCFNHDIDLVAGSQTISLHVTDRQGRRGTRSIIVHRKGVGGNFIRIVAPSDGATVFFEDVSIEGVYGDPYVKKIDVYANGDFQETVDSFFGSSFTARVELDEGENLIRVVEEDHFGDTTQDEIVLIYSSSGLSAGIACGEGQNPCYTNAGQVTVSGTVPSALDVIATLTVKNSEGTQEYPLGLTGADNAFSQTIVLEAGSNTLKIIAEDAQGRAESGELVIIRDNDLPEVRIEFLQNAKPAPNVTASDATDIKVLYTEKYPRTLEWRLNSGTYDGVLIESPAFPREDFHLAEGQLLREGSNLAEATVEDKAGNRNSASASIILDTAAPEIRITTVTAPEHTIFHDMGKYKTNAESVIIHGTYADDNFKAVYLEGKSKTPVDAIGGSFEIEVPVSAKKGTEAEYNFTVVAEDQGGLTAEATVTVVVDNGVPTAEISNMATEGGKYYTAEERPLIDILVSEQADCELVYRPKDFTSDFIQPFTDLGDHDHRVQLLNNLDFAIGENTGNSVIVQCTDVFGNAGESLKTTIVVDKVEPSIISFGLSNALLEEEEEDTKRYTVVTNPFTEIFVDEASEPLRCRYGTSPDFDTMTNQFGDYPSFKLSTLSGIIELVDQQEYTYYFGCEDRALRQTDIKRLEAFVNLSRSVRIIDAGPQRYATSLNPVLYVETLRQATCQVDRVWQDGNAISDWIRDLFDPGQEMVPNAGRFYRQELQLFGLEESATYAFDVYCEDVAGELEGAETTIEFMVVGPLDVELEAPRHGASRFLPFPIKVTTNRFAECRYDASGVPHNFINKKRFEVTDADIHVIYSYPGIGPFNVMCQDEFNYTEARSYMLTLSRDQPVILAAEARPARVLYQVDDGVAGTTDLETMVVVDTNEETVCRYSDRTRNYLEMEKMFMGHDPENRSSFSEHHEMRLTNLPDETEFLIHVACENLAGRFSDASDVAYVTNLNAPLDIYFNEPRDNGHYAQGDLDINISTNKLSTCYYGASEENISRSFSKSDGLRHFNELTGDFDDGSHVLWVECEFGQESLRTSTTFSVDGSKPEDPVVTQENDTNRLDRLKASWSAADPESGIARYEYAIGSTTTKQDIVDWTDVGPDTSDTAYGLSLTKGRTYYWFVRAENGAGIWSDIGRGSGTRVLESATNSTGACHDELHNGHETDTDCGGPDPDCGRCGNGKGCDEHDDCTSGYCGPDDFCGVDMCENGLQDDDTDETDIDCGGDCEPCGVGDSCEVNADCGSATCTGGICVEASCSDHQRNGFESGVDCGGPTCDMCPSGEGCEEHEDCESGVCDNRFCSEESCDDGVKNGDEIDRDCGGSCGKCGDGKRCVNGNDCLSGNCDEGYCEHGTTPDSTGGNDDDNDGMPNEWELANGLNPQLDDAMDDRDEDELTNYEEYVEKTDPRMADTDDDGFDDVIELDAGTDPLNPDSHPSKSSFFSVLLLILAIIALLAGGGYLAYEEVYKKRAKKRPKTFSGDTPFGKGPQKPLGTPPIKQEGPPISDKPPVTKTQTKRKEQAEQYLNRMRRTPTGVTPMKDAPKDAGKDWLSLEELAKDKPRTAPAKSVTRTGDIFEELGKKTGTGSMTPTSVPVVMPKRKMEGTAGSTKHPEKKAEDSIFDELEKKTGGTKKRPAGPSHPISDDIFEELEKKTGKGPMKSGIAPVKSKAKPSPSTTKEKAAAKKKTPVKTPAPTKRAAKPKAAAKKPAQEDPFKRLKESGLVSKRRIEELAASSGTKGKDVFKELETDVIEKDNRMKDARKRK
ncbi:MAG: hypothetical protein ABIC95_04725 [archaeon]